MIGSVDLQIFEVMKKPQMQGVIDLTLLTTTKHGPYVKKPATLKIEAVLRLMVANQPTPISSARTNRLSTQENFDINRAVNSPDRPGNSKISHDELDSAVVERVDLRQRKTDQINSSPSVLVNASNDNQATDKSDLVPSRRQGLNSVSEFNREFDVQMRTSASNGIVAGSKSSTLERRTATLENAYSSIDTRESSRVLKRFQSVAAVDNESSVHFEDHVKTPLIHLGFHFSQSKNRLVVEVVEAKYLSLLLHHKLNTYVILRLVSTASGPREQSHTTEVARTENPIWYRSFEFNVTDELLRSSVLITTLLNHVDKQPFGYCKIHLSKLSLSNDYFWFPVKPTSHSVLPVRKFRATEV